MKGLGDCLKKFKFWR